MFKSNKEYMLCSIYDTETTNIQDGINSKAYCILYIINDIRFRDLNDYEINDDKEIYLYRTKEELLNYIDELVKFGVESNIIPIICAYNLMFDLQTILYDLNFKYDMEINAQSTTNAYTLDLLISGVKVLRFWDTFHLEMSGIEAMGQICGIKKASGSWDYSKIRTKETKLTSEEIYYAKRDVQVIPAYLSYLLKSNDWLKQSDFGVTVLTKTSLVRQMAKRKIGNIKISKRNGRKLSLSFAFKKTCEQQLPKTFQQYAIRKAAFRGGFTFTSGIAASRVLENVGSLDVTSMHHAFINGRYIPIDFNMTDKETLEYNMNCILSYSVEKVLKNYKKPFACAFHALFSFTNLRLKKDSCFDKWQIALIPSGKFRNNVIAGTDYGVNMRDVEAENYIREKGWHDYAENPLFAFGKLYSASLCNLYLSELELWCIAQVYEWDSIEVLFGESTVKFKLPPDYITLQSNSLFEMKNDVKVITKNYKYGEKYKLDIPNSIPENIALLVKNGECEESFLNSYYNSNVKGMFNGIYGTMAQDVFKPNYMVENGEILVDNSTKTTEDNFEEKRPNNCKVLYTYGLRIVGSSRMHLIIAMILLYESLGDKITITGGDTDSLKIRCDEDITNDILLKALEPLHNAITIAIDETMYRVRECYPQYASSLKDVGIFECEKCDGYDRYKYHMEAWNKARISISQDMNIHVTCAGLSRPPKMYHIELFIKDMLKNGYDIHEILPLILGYNVFVTHDICHALEHKRPKVTDTLDINITDYLGDTYRVNQTQAIALYNSGRMLGDTSKKTNYDNVKYLRDIQKINIDDSEKWLEYVNNKPRIRIGGEIMYEG